MRFHDLGFRTLHTALFAAATTILPAGTALAAEIFADTIKRQIAEAGSDTADTGLGIFGILFSDASRDGADAFASGTVGLGSRPANPPTDSRSVSAMFQSLSPPQQERVMERCKEVLAAPAQANANQVALCQTLAAAGER